MRLPRKSRLLSGALGVCIALMLLASCSADRILLGENYDHVDTAGLRRSILTVSGKHVECWIATSPGVSTEQPAKAVVLYLTGKGSLAESWTKMVAQSWGDKPVEVWGMNYPGSGGSDGPAKIDSVSARALGTYDEIAKVTNGRPVFLQSASFGTTVALDIAAHRQVAGVVTHKPPPLKQLILNQYGWWNLWILAGPIARKVPDDLDSLKNAPNCTAPAVFIIHGADEIIATDLQRRVANAYAGPKRVIENAGANHDAPLTHEASEESTDALNWLWKSAFE